MPVGTAHESYLTLLLDNVRSSRFPSHGVLDRIEGAIADRRDAEAYVEVLLDKSRSQHPSLRLLDRAGRIVRLLARADQLEEAARENQDDHEHS
ncbi:MAG TPA: hypothetical protein VG452_01170 [Egibacteraceae bacterium]|nr:hypothetical protein [Egibacteraceae bacterium]